MHLISEFGSVTVSVDDSANGPRLRLEDRKTGQVAYLDPLQLESLVWATEEDMERLVDPSRTRWRNHEEETQELPGSATLRLAGGADQ